MSYHEFNTFNCNIHTENILNLNLCTSIVSLKIQTRFKKQLIKILTFKILKSVGPAISFMRRLQ